MKTFRAVAVDSSIVNLGRFPSLNPTLCYREKPDDLILTPYDSVRQNPREYYDRWWNEKKDIEWQTVSDAYWTWWTQNKDKDLNETMRIYPLQHTIYGWMGHVLYKDH